MQTTFFQSIFDLSENADWKITISKLGKDRLIVTILPFNKTVNDKAKQLVQPMILKGTPVELDESFFMQITEPVNETTNLFCNMKSYQKQLEEAKANSKEEEKKEEATKRDKDSKRKKFDEQMKKVDELEQKEKYGEAIGQMPKLDQFPEFKDEITKRMDELRSKHGQLSLL